MLHFLGQLLISILGGIIAGIILTLLLRPELKQILSKEAVKKFFDKEVIVAIILVVVVGLYAAGVYLKLIPPPEFHDYMEVIDSEGYRCILDACHPEKELQRMWKEPTWKAIGPDGKVHEPDKAGRIYIEYPEDPVKSQSVWRGE